MHFGGPEASKKQSRKFNKIKGRQKFGFISPQVGEAGGRLIRNKNDLVVDDWCEVALSEFVKLAFVKR